MHKADKEFRIPTNLVKDYLSAGYQLGRPAEIIDKVRQACIGKCMTGKTQSDHQKEIVSKACAYKRTEEQCINFSKAKKVKNKYICMRTPDNKSTIRCLKENVEKYLTLGYILADNTHPGERTKSSKEYKRKYYQDHKDVYKQNQKKCN